MLRLQRTAQRCGTPASLSEPVYQRCVVWPDALELLLVAARPTFAEPDVVACAARPGALALRLFAGRVAERQLFAEPGVVARPALLGRDALPVQRALLGPGVLPALLLPALAASVLSHRHSMAVSLQPKSELLSIAKVFS